MSNEDNSQVHCRLRVQADSTNGKILGYLVKASKAGSTPQQLILQVLRTFYLPYAYADCSSSKELQSLARVAISELIHRVVLLHLEFLPGEPLFFPAVSGVPVSPMTSPVALQAEKNSLPLAITPLATLPKEVADEYLDDF